MRKPFQVCCPSGGSWTAWSTTQTCPDTCGSCAQLTYTRTCTSSPTCPCSGSSSKSVNCNLAPCQYPRTSCCGSYKAMAVSEQVICGPQPTEPIDTPSGSTICTAVSNIASGTTCPPGGQWSSWTQAVLQPNQLLVHHNIVNSLGLHVVPGMLKALVLLFVFLIRQCEDAS
uniref:Uncharacterized protein n=1 Tax=Acrobeloides nanus TaxID=290746 RepID=A0A914ES63_9BILA